MPRDRRRTKASRALVIDASVAQAAGSEQTTHPTGRLCRAFLQDVLSICHRAVMTPELNREWREHRSKFAHTWLRSMFARKKVVQVSPMPGEPLRDDVERAIDTPGHREAAEKDMHLIEAALATDRAIISRDEEARGIFSAASSLASPLREIMWANPEKAGEKGRAVAPGWGWG